MSFWRKSIRKQYFLLKVFKSFPWEITYYVGCGFSVNIENKYMIPISTLEIKTNVIWVFVVYLKKYFLFFFLDNKFKIRFSICCGGSFFVEGEKATSYLFEVKKSILELEFL